MPVTTVFFDLDGTLIDTAWFHTLAWWRALADQGHAVPMAEIHPLIGMGGQELLHALLGHDEPSARDAHGRYFKEYRDRAAPLPGAKELLVELRRRSVKAVLVTSGQPDDTDALLGLLDARDLFAEVVHSEAADRAKPEPDLFQQALVRAAVRPEEALAVGDAEWDVQAAGRAGVASVGVLTGGTAESVLRQAGASEVYRDCQGILDGWASGPFADAGPA